MKELRLDSVYVIVNSGMKSEAFIYSIEKHLGEMHPLSEGGGAEHIARSEGDKVWVDTYTRQLVGFGGETWRGMLYHKNGTAHALRLIYNGEKELADITLATCGLAVLTFNRWARFSDVIPAPA